MAYPFHWHVFLGSTGMVGVWMVSFRFNILAISFSCLGWASVWLYILNEQTLAYISVTSMFHIFTCQIIVIRPHCNLLPNWHCLVLFKTFNTKRGSYHQSRLHKQHERNCAKLSFDKFAITFKKKLDSSIHGDDRGSPIWRVLSDNSVIKMIRKPLVQAN